MGMTAQMASESRLRAMNWLKNGCNGFDMKSPISNPMSFWTEQDVLEYIYHNHIPIADVYGEVVADYGKGEAQGDSTDWGFLMLESLSLILPDVTGRGVFTAASAVTGRNHRTGGSWLRSSHPLQS